MGFEIPRRSIFVFECCNEGRSVDKNTLKNQDGISIPVESSQHPFLIISDGDYNKNEGTKYISGIPLTHTVNNKTKQFNGFQLESSDLEFGDYSQSIVLCDRPTRIFKINMKRPWRINGKVSYEAYQKIISKVAQNCGVCNFS